PECVFALWLWPAFGSWTELEFAEASRRDLLASRIVAARKFETRGLSHRVVANAITAAEPQDYAVAGAALYRLWGSRKGKSIGIWGDKNNYFLAHIGELKALFPSARFLHIVRDGRDVACSYREVMALRTSSIYRPELPVEIGEIAARWSGDVRTIRDQLGRIASDDTLELRYEDLVRDAPAELRRICLWLGVEFEARMLRFHEANRKQGLEPAATLDWKTRTLDPVNGATVSRHRSLLSDDERLTFDLIAGP